MNLRSIVGQTGTGHDDNAPDRREHTRHRHDGMTIDFVECEPLEQDPESGGEWVFKDSGVALKHVLWHIAQNRNLDETVEEFRGLITRSAIAQVLDHMAERLDTAGWLIRQ